MAGNTHHMCLVAKASRHVEKQFLCDGLSKYEQKLTGGMVPLVSYEASCAGVTAAMDRQCG